MLGGSYTPITFVVNDLFTHDGGNYCGAAEVVFESRVGSAAWAALNPTFFTSDIVRLFKVGTGTSNTEQIGVHEFRYKVKFTNSGRESAWSNQTPAFTWTVSAAVVNCNTATLVVTS